MTRDGIHVAFVATPDLSYVSGSSLSLRYLTARLATRNVRSTVLCQHRPDGVPADDGSVRYDELPLPLDYQVITDRECDDRSLWLCIRMLTDALLATHARTPVDVVHAIYGTFTGAAAMIAAALIGCPFVVTSYGRDVMHGRRADARYDALMRSSYGTASAVVASDAEVARAISGIYGVPPDRLVVIPPPVNLEMMRRGPARPAPAGRARLLAVQSSFSPAKGLDVLVEAVGALRRSGTEVELWVVGHDDTPDLRHDRALRRRCDDLALTGVVRFLGHQPHHAMPALYEQADVVVDPRVIDSFSSCTYEALAAGRAVVASDVPCNVTALEGGELGWLVPSGDPEAFAATIADVLTGHAGVRDRLARIEESHPRLESKVGCDTIADRVVALYSWLLSRPAGEAQAPDHRHIASSEGTTMSAPAARSSSAV